MTLGSFPPQCQGVQDYCGELAQGMIRAVEVEDGTMADEDQAPEEAESGKPVTEVEALMDVQVEITAVLGTSNMPISQILKLGRGAVVELNRSVGEDIEVHANNRLVAMGEVIVVDDRLGVTMTEIIKTTS